MGDRNVHGNGQTAANAKNVVCRLILIELS